MLRWEGGKHIAKNFPYRIARVLPNFFGDLSYSTGMPCWFVGSNIVQIDCQGPFSILAHISTGAVGAVAIVASTAPTPAAIAVNSYFK